jgi:diguanylate cyclase (GGDEF)-like protein
MIGIEQANLNDTLEKRIELRTDQLMKKTHQLEQANEKLKQAEQQLHLAIEASKNGIFEWDLTNNKFNYSPELQRMFGLQSDLITLNKPVWVIRSNKMRSDDISQQVINQLDSNMEDFNLQCQLVAAEEKQREFLFQGRILRDNNNQATQIVGTCLDVTAQKASMAEMEYIATHDSLTGLANRSLLLENIKHSIHMCKRQGRQFAVHILDMDNFKIINDEQGHVSGDIALKELAKRLTHLLRAEDIIARLGGDEFVIIQQEVNTLDQAKNLTDRILASLAVPITFREQEYSLMSSIGTYCSLVSVDSDETSILDKADKALYKVKRTGKGRAEMYTASQ